MKPNQIQHSAWESFMHTGRVEDYLQYRSQVHKELTGLAEGIVKADAADNRRDRPAGLQNRRG